MHDGTRVARLVSGQCPLYAEIYDLLFKASCEVDWILIGFYPCLTDQIVNAAIIDCRNNMGSVEKVGVAPDPKRVGPASWNLEHG